MTSGDATTSPTEPPKSLDSLSRRNVLASLTALVGGCTGQGDSNGTDTTGPVTGKPMNSVTHTPTPREPVVVAGTLPLSGSLSDIGGSLRNGLFVWAQEFNTNGGFGGRPIDLRIKNDGGNPDAAREAYRSLVKEADLLVTPYGSLATKTVFDIVESASIPCIAHTAGARELWANGRTWTVQLINPVDTFLHSLLAAVDHQGAESMALLYRDDSFTPTMMEGAIERARQQGWTVTGKATYTSTSRLASKMTTVTDPNPDLLIGGGFQPGAKGGGFLPDSLALSRVYQTVNGDAELVNWAIGASFPAFRRRRGKAADLETGVTGWKAYVDYPGNSGFAKRYHQHVGDPPDTHAAQGYAAGQVLGAAVDRAGSIDPIPVRDALFSLRTTTVFGRYRVNERGLQVGKENAVVQWLDGTPAVVWPKRWRDQPLVYPA